MKERAQVKEEEVRRIILESFASSDLAQKLELVDTLQRIGVDYHYKEEVTYFVLSTMTRMEVLMTSMSPH